MTSENGNSGPKRRPFVWSFISALFFWHLKKLIKFPLHTPSWIMSTDCMRLAEKTMNQHANTSSAGRIEHEWKPLFKGVVVSLHRWLFDLPPLIVNPYLRITYDSLKHFARITCFLHPTSRVYVSCCRASWPCKCMYLHDSATVESLKRDRNTACPLTRFLHLTEFPSTKRCGSIT